MQTGASRRSSPTLVKRPQHPNYGYKRLVNLVTAWKHEIEEIMGGMGINSLEALRGNRLMLRGIGLTDTEFAAAGRPLCGRVAVKERKL